MSRHSIPRVRINCEGYCLNVEVNGNFHVISNEHTSCLKRNGQVIIRRRNKSLLNNTSEYVPRTGFPYANFGLFPYLVLLHAINQLRLTAFGLRNIAALGAVEDQVSLSTTVLAVRSFLLEQQFGMIVNHFDLEYEEVALAIARALPNTPILFVTTADSLIKTTTVFLRKNGIDALNLTEKHANLENFRPQSNCVVSTMMRANDIYFEYGVMVALDRFVLARPEFHMALSRRHSVKPVPRLFCVVKERHLQQNFARLCATFGFDSLHLGTANRVRKDIRYARIPYTYNRMDGDFAPSDSLALCRKLYWYNGERNRLALKVAKHFASGQTIRGRSFRLIERYRLENSDARVLIVFDHIKHALHVIKRLENWRFISRSLVSGYERSGLSSEQKTLINQRLAIESPHAITLGDSLQRVPTDAFNVILLVGAHTSSLPQKLQFTSSINRELLIIDFEDRANAHAKSASDRRLNSLLEQDVYPVNGTLRTLYISRFHMRQLAGSDHE